jgi:hypothetical protein
LFGVIVGLGFLNKVSILFIGFAVLAALWMTPERKHFLTRWLWIGGLIGGVFLLPFLYWQATQGWPILSFGKYYSAGKTYPVTFPEFVWFQVFAMHPFTLPIWLTGLGVTFLSRRMKRYRLFGWIYLILFALFVLLRAKFYFLLPVYTVLLASGAVSIEGFIENRNWRKAKGIILSLLVLGGSVTAPLSMPILPVETLVKMLGSLGKDPGIRQERHVIEELPQHFADRLGWEEMAMAVAKVYSGLPAEERSKACILTGNYGEAGAIRFFGQKYGLPEPISAHGWHYYQGPGKCTGEVVISIGMPIGDLQSMFDEVIQAGIFRCRYCMPYENNQPIYVCREPRRLLREVWRHLKHLD